MKAIGYKESLTIDKTNALIDIELPKPVAKGRDVLIEVKAIAVNPVDTKIRKNVAPVDGSYKVLGWDAVGEIVAVGENAKQFSVGESVYYAGALSRQGSNAEYQLVDERLIAKKPNSLSNAQAAALPLTAITAWEMLFDHLNIKQEAVGSDVQSNEIVLVVGAAGGVGSILVQLLKAITGATIIATASRDSSKQWVEDLGADHVVNHSKPLGPQIEKLNIGQVTHVASLNATGSYFDSYTEFMSPFGKIALIDDPAELDFTKLKMKSLSLHAVFMFTRAMFETADMEQQGKLLKQLSELVDQGHIKTTMGKNLGVINAANLKAAHKELEASTSIGKLVLEGF